MGRKGWEERRKGKKWLKCPKLLQNYLKKHAKVRGEWDAQKCPKVLQNYPKKRVILPPVRTKKLR